LETVVFSLYTYQVFGLQEKYDPEEKRVIAIDEDRPAVGFKV
jgi:hypothetical protein